MPTTHSADTEYLARNAMNAGYQLTSLLIPPLYVGFTLASPARRAAFSLNRMLRATWVGGIGGSITTGGLAYTWYRTIDQDQLRVKRLQVAYDHSRLRANDHSTIGGILMAVLTPALFWNRAHTINLVLGGAGLGTGLGLLTHYARGDIPPKPPAMLNSEGVK